MARQQHHYRTCRDQDCPRLACQAYREGRQDGWHDGYDAGWPEGYAAGAASAGGQ